MCGFSKLIRQRQNYLRSGPPVVMRRKYAVTCHLPLKKFAFPFSYMKYGWLFRCYRFLRCYKFLHCCCRFLQYCYRFLHRYYRFLHCCYRFLYCYYSFLYCYYTFLHYCYRFFHRYYRFLHCCYSLAWFTLFTLVVRIRYFLLLTFVNEYVNKLKYRTNVRLLFNSIEFTHAMQ